MKIRFGKYILNGKEALRILDQQQQQLSNLKAHRQEAADYAKSILAQHQPFLRGPHNGGFDVSTTATEELRDTLVERMGKELWCQCCRTPWPCRQLEPLRSLHNALAYSDFDGVVPPPLDAPERADLVKVAL